MNLFSPKNLEADGKVLLQKAGLYIHIPFCRQVCGYCAFAVTAKGKDDEDLQLRYLKALEKELDAQLKSSAVDLEFETLYIGGGTPSLLTDKALEYLFGFLSRALNFLSLKEISFECNPEDVVARPYLPELLDSFGVRRVSLGAQTLNEQGLKLLERRASSDMVKNSVEIFENSAIKHLCLDWILGWPQQRVEDFEKEDLAFLKEAKFEHLSAYFLNCEPETRLTRMVEAGRLSLPDEELESSLWDLLHGVFMERGWHHYEISSICEHGKESLHNRAGWRGAPYLGLGAGAVSRIDQMRWTGLKSLRKYLEAVEAGKAPVGESEFLDKNTLWQEDLFLSLRHSEGFNRQAFLEQHSFDPLACLGEQRQRWLNEGWMLVDDCHARFSSAGWKLYDSLLSDWWLAIEKHLLRLQMDKKK